MPPKGVFGSHTVLVGVDTGARYANATEATKRDVLREQGEHDFGVQLWCCSTSCLRAASPGKPRSKRLRRVRRCVRRCVANHSGAVARRGSCRQPDRRRRTPPLPQVVAPRHGADAVCDLGGDSVSSLLSWSEPMTQLCRPAPRLLPLDEALALLGNEVLVVAKQVRLGGLRSVESRANASATSGALHRSPGTAGLRPGRVR